MSTAIPRFRHPAVHPAPLPSVGMCAHLEELKAQLARAVRAHLEQDERAKGTFSNFYDARKASDLAESMAQDVYELRLRMKSHRELHGCE